MEDRNNINGDYSLSDVDNNCKQFVQAVGVVSVIHGVEKRNSSGKATR